MEWFGGEMPKTFGGALILAILVLLLITKSFRGVVVPVITSISSIMIVYGLLGYSGYTIDSSMMSIPILVAFAISIAYNIHIITYFKRQFNTHGKRKQAVIETISEMGWPVLFSALTTFMALLTIIFIPVVPLHFIGIATSSCVFITFLFALIIMPIFLSFGKNKKELTHNNKEHKTGLDKFLAHIGNWSLNHGNTLLVIFTIIMIIFLIGVTKIETAFDVERTMGRKIEYVDNILTVSESELGSIYSYDILVEFKEENQAKHYPNLIQLDSLSQYINHLPLTKRTTSILDIVKDLNQTINENQESQYTIPSNDNQIAQLLLLYENAGGSEAEYWIDYDYRRLRIMVELNNYNSQEAEKELQQVNARAQKLFPNAKVTTVGALPQFTAMMQYVVRGQIVSFGLALLVITLLLMLVFGKIKIGLVGIIPNIVPAIVVGGIMGWLDIPLDMMSATIIPMILGLSVDDTIHFINHSHLEFNRQRSYYHAVRRTFFIVGSPMVLTTLIISSNFGVYLLSDGNSIFNMGFLSVAGMLSALISDLFITPVLIEKFKLFGPENK